MARQLELLAPAKNLDIGIAAIDCGADAVYIAGPAFGARQAAGNSMDDIAELCTHAHRYGARIFITLNTILYDEEIAEAKKILHGVEEAGADAVIVQDLAIAAAAAEDRLRIPLHASTQCAIQTPGQARFYESLGFSRLVLERQLSLDRIREIRKAVDCELEFFVHGALCVCYSGQCYLSEMIAGRSANRGACIQACRSRYDLCDRNGRTIVKDKPLLSLKDLNLADRLEDLAEAGITSFKIEGRLKNKSYVKNTVLAYSAELDRLIETGKAGDFCRASYGKTAGGFTPDLAKTFNRGYTELYIDGKKGQWNSTDAAKSMGEEIGTISYVSRTKDLLKIRPAKGKEAPVLHNGDGFAFVSGSDVIGFRADICNGLEIRCRKVPELKEGIRLYRNLDAAFEKEIDKAPVSREIRVSLSVSAEDRGEGSKDRFMIAVSARTEDGRDAEITFPAGDVAAENRERMMSMISGQLSRHTGIYSFAVTQTTCGEGDGCRLPFLPASFLNGIRRAVAEKLDSIPCNRRPLMHRTIHIPDTASAVQEQSCTYKDNVSNSVARDLYTRLGRKTQEPAYELSHRPGAELMRSRYCIRHELGICPRQGAGGGPGPLYLINNGRRLVLDFDCAKCEMTVKDG